MATGINADLKHKTNEMFPNITTLYFDMDGVLANFAKGAEKVGAWIEKDGETVLDWSPIYDVGEDFWANLEWTPNGKELFTKVYDYVTSKGCQVCILSAVHYKEGIEGKKTWLKNNLPKNVHIKAYFTKDGNDKAGYITNVGKYADEDCVLIDDFGKNCKFFEEHGGHAIKFSGNVDEVLTKLKKLFEWDIHERYLIQKTMKAMNEIDMDFESFKKKSLDEGLDDKVTSFLANKINSGIKSGTNAIKDKAKETYINYKKEKKEANGIKFSDIESGKGIYVKTTDDIDLFITFKSGSPYIAYPNKFRKLDIKEENGSLIYNLQFGSKTKDIGEENFNKLFEAYENHQFYVPCEIEADEDGYNLNIGEESIISINLNDIPNQVKMIYNGMPAEIKATISDFEIKTFSQINKEIIESVSWYKEIKDKSIKGGEVSTEGKVFSFDKSSDDNKKESYKKLKYAFETLEKFTYKASSGETYNIEKENGENYVIFGEEKKRPVILSKEGIVIAII